MPSPGLASGGASPLRGLWAGHELPTGRPARTGALGSLSRKLAPYLMLAPALLLLLAVSAYPLYYSVRVSLESRTSVEAGRFIGLDNYSQLLHDPAFWSSLKVTAIFTLAAVTIELLLGLGLAVVLSPLEGRIARGFRVVLIMPMIIAPLIVGITWRILYQTTGPIAYIAAQLGFGNVDILGTSSTALPALIAIDVWEWTPFMFLILLAGLQSLPQEPYEAARVDGASPLRQFLTLTLPMLRPVLLVALLLRTIDAFAVFDQVYAVTGGGPGQSTEVLGLYTYDLAFRYTQIGYAAAVVFAMLLALMIVTTAIMHRLRRSRRWL
jgi:multiple sugar transport system permease protein